MDAAADTPLLVACLCAAWCGTCRDYFPGFAEQSGVQAADTTFLWVDIEDHDEVPGDLDIDNFPTLLIARGDQTLFFGTVLPHLSTLVRMLESARAGDLKPITLPALAGLPARVRAVAGATRVRPGDPPPVAAG